MTDQFGPPSREELEACERAVRMGGYDAYQDDPYEGERAMVGIVNAVLLTAASAAAVTLVLMAGWVWLS